LTSQLTSRGSRGTVAGGIVSLALTVFALLLCASPALAVAPAPGSISGTVTDAVTHNPVEGVLVCAYNESSATFEEECEPTDSSGQYTLEGLGAGEYLVEFWPGFEDLNYIRQFYNGKSTWQSADLVQVTSVTHATDIDAALSEGGTIKGKVVAAIGKAPLKGVEVCAITVSEEFGECDLTDVAGEYSIAGLKAGSYKVEFWPGNENPDSLPQFFKNKSLWSTATVVPVTAGTTASNVDAELQTGGRISGTVTDASTHTALEEILVCAFDASGEPHSCEFTDSAGKYTLFRLLTASYRVGFFSEFEEEEGQYFTQFYAGKSKFSEASFVPVVAPNTTAGIDAQMVNKHPPVVVAPATPPAAVQLPLPAPHLKSIKCKKGFKKKRAKGKVRCVRAHKAKHHRGGHRSHRGSARLLDATR
jgi:hypothetical protein